MSRQSTLAITLQDSIAKRLSKDWANDNRSKLTPTDVRLARAMYKEGYKLKFILRKMPTNASYNAVKEAIHGRRWKWLD